MHHVRPRQDSNARPPRAKVSSSNHSPPAPVAGMLPKWIISFSIPHKHDCSYSTGDGKPATAPRRSLSGPRQGGLEIFSHWHVLHAVHAVFYLFTVLTR